MIKRALATTAAVLLLAACGESPTEAPLEDATLRAPVEAAAPSETGLSARCQGQVVSGIASTWPWAHNDKAAFAPPKGSLAQWIEIIGPGLGIESVQDLEDLFCVA